MVYILTRSEIEQLIDMKTAVALTERAYSLYAQQKAFMPPKVYLTFPEGDMRAMPAYLHDADLDVAGIKCVTVHPQNPKQKIPTVIASTTIIDPKTGMPLAFMDSTFLTALRTGAGGGVAIKHLANPDAKCALFVGTGVQARSQVDALMVVRPDIEEIRCYDISAARRDAFSKYCQDTYGMPAISFDALVEATSAADIIITTTPAREPVVMREHVKKGCHINAIGADAEGKQELDTDLTASSVVIADDWDQASHSGELNVPVHQGKYTKTMLRASLGEVTAGMKKGRLSKDEITVYDSTGLAILDIIVSDYVYKQVLKNPSAYLSVNLFE